MNASPQQNLRRAPHFVLNAGRAKVRNPSLGKSLGNRRAKLQMARLRWTTFGVLERVIGVVQKCNIHNSRPGIDLRISAQHVLTHTWRKSRPRRTIPNLGLVVWEDQVGRLDKETSVRFCSTSTPARSVAP